MTMLVVIHDTTSNQPDYPIIKPIGCLREVWLQAFVIFHCLESPVKFGDMGKELELGLVLNELLCCAIL